MLTNIKDYICNLVALAALNNMLKSNIKQTNHSLFARRFGAWLSGLCAVHCVIFPIVLVSVPFVEAYAHLSTAVEITVYASILIFGGSFLWQDYQKHQKKIPLVLFLTGFVLLLIAHCVPHFIAHFGITIFAGVLLATAQVYNIRLHKRICHTH